MITKITGQLVFLEAELATLLIDAFEYEVSIPEYTRRQLQSAIGQKVSLHTIFYHEGDPSRGRVQPKLVGFLDIVEREFFELFCSVDGVGPKKALRAMVRPVQDISIMIEEQDAKGLSGLPGVGAATAERIIAKLRRKMSKFALLVAKEAAAQTETKRDVVDETYQVLIHLGHAPADARRLIDEVLKSKKKFTDVESVLAAIYQQGQGRAG